MKTLLVGYKAADLTPELLKGDVTCHVLALSLGTLSPVVVLALQNIGGAAGNMICVNNVVAVCATTGVSGCEGRIIRINLIPCFVYCLVAIAVLGLLV